VLLCAATQAAEPQFERNIRPLLTARCGACRGPQTRTAGLDLHEASLILRGSRNGAVIVQGSPEASLRIRRVREGSMPPDGKNRLTSESPSAIMVQKKA